MPFIPLITLTAIAQQPKRDTVRCLVKVFAELPGTGPIFPNAQKIDAPHYSLQIVRAYVILGDTVKFLLPDRKTELKGVWKAEGRLPEYMIFDWKKI